MHPYPHGPYGPRGPFDPHDPDGLTEQVTLVRVDGLVDVIAAVPYVLTYVPQDAVVVMAFVRDTLRVTACQALPAPADVALAGDYLDQVLRRACREPGDQHRPGQSEALGRADGSAAVVTQALVVGYGPAVIDPILIGIADRLTVPVWDVVRVLDGRWWSLTCPDPGCCPPGGPVAAAEHVRVALLVAAGAPAATRSDRSSELDPAPPALLDQVSTALTHHHDDRHGDVDRHGDDDADGDGGDIVLDPGDRYALLAAVKEHYDHRPMAGAGAGVGPRGAAVLLAALDDVRVRDACILWNDQAGVRLWRDLVRLAPPGWVAPAATLLALTAYQQGDSVLANLAIARALDDDPRYRLAGMVRQVLHLGLPPQRLTADLQDMAEDVLSRLALPEPSHDDHDDHDDWRM